MNHRDSRLVGWVIGAPLIVATLAIAGIFAWAIYDHWQTEADRSRELEGGAELGPGLLRYAARTPQWSPDGRYITANLGHSIFRVPVTGGPVVRTPDKALTGQYSPSLAPDGRVAYLGIDSGRKHQVTDAQGQNPRDVHNGEYYSHVVEWSPDGSSLFYITGLHADGASENQRLIPLAVVDPEEGPNVTWQLSSFYVKAAVWAPDNRHIAIWSPNFVDGVAVPDGSILSVVQWDGPVESLIDRGGPGSPINLSEPGWTEDGGLYYVKRELSDGKWYSLLYRTDADGRERRLIANLTAQRLTIAGDPVRRLHISKTQLLGEVLAVKPSPDGQKMLLIATTTVRNVSSGTTGAVRPAANVNEPVVYDGQRIGVYLWTVGDPTMVQLPTSGQRSRQFQFRPYVSWSPDGQRIAVVDTLIGSLSIVNSDGSDYRTLFTDDTDSDKFCC